MIFDIFVFYTLFNQFNCRVIDDSLNIFIRINRSLLFPLICLLEMALQVIIIFVGNSPFHIVSSGLTGTQWGICIGFSAITFVVSIITKFIPVDRLIDNYLDKKAREEELVRREAVLKKKEKSLDVERRTFTKEQQAYEELLDDKYDEIKNEYKIMLFKLNPKLFGARDRYIGKSKTIQDFRDEFVSEAITYIEDLQKEFDRVKAERQKVLEEQKKVEKIRAEYEAKESELSKRVAEMAEDLFNQRMKIENERKGLQHKDYFDIK